MHTGKVVQFSAEKGWGFIRFDEDGTDIFCHWSAIQQDGYKKLETGQRVQFGTEIGPKGKVQACNVYIIEEVASGRANSQSQAKR